MMVERKALKKLHWLDCLMEKLMVWHWLLPKGSRIVERKALKKLYWLDYSMEQLTVWN
jgi:hypothetical protein